MLRHVRELAGDRPVVGLAPSAAAARVLERETDIRARTLQWFLTRCRALDAAGPVNERLREMFGGAVLVLDEASMVSTDQMGELMRVAGALDVARLVLVGDRSQLRAVEAGQPFRQLQEAGMTTARMEDILRQKNPELKAAVLSVLAGRPGGGDGDAGRRGARGGLRRSGNEGGRGVARAGQGDPRRHAAAGADPCAQGGDQRTVREALAEEGF